MTTNKALIISICGLNLENPDFAYEQLYVAWSRVGKLLNILVLATETLTNNIVNRLAFN